MINLASSFVALADTSSSLATPFQLYMSEQNNHTFDTEKNRPSNEAGMQRVEIVIGDSDGHIPEPSPIRELDGGWNGWMTVAGSWLILFSTLGYIYSFGVYQDYYTRIFLIGHDPSSIAWMGSFQLALPFAMGPLAGRVFDAGYARLIVSFGSLIFVFSLFMLSLVQEGQYYQVFLSQGVGMGLGTGLLFTPSTAIVSVHFKQRRSLAYGAALTGISIGALVFPILLNQLIPKLGFANAVRLTGYITLGCLTAGIALIRPPPRVSRARRSVDIASFFHDPIYLWFLLLAVVTLLSIYFPAFYLQLYAVEHNINNTLAFYSLAILNGVGIVGRVGGCWLADRYGIWNTLAPTTLGTAAMIWAILGTRSAASLVVVSCLYGIFSGAWLAVAVSGLVSLASSPYEVGARVGVANAFMSVGLLVSGPVQGALLSSEFHWVRPIVFSGTLMTISTALCVLIRTLISRRKKCQWV